MRPERLSGEIGIKAGSVSTEFKRRSKLNKCVVGHAPAFGVAPGDLGLVSLSKVELGLSETFELAAVTLFDACLLMSVLLIAVALTRAY